MLLSEFIFSHVETAILCTFSLCAFLSKTYFQETHKHPIAIADLQISHSYCRGALGPGAQPC